jgi:hypothetical protein
VFSAEMKNGCTECGHAAALLLLPAAAVVASTTCATSSSCAAAASGLASRRIDDAVRSGGCSRCWPRRRWWLLLRLWRGASASASAALRTHASVRPVAGGAAVACLRSTAKQGARIYVTKDEGLGYSNYM